MMKILKHFEEQTAEDDLELMADDTDESGDDQSSDLAKRLENVDLCEPPSCGL